MPEPPSWAPAEEQASIASPRTHSTSDAHTAFYNRTDLCQQGAESTKTEILEELEGKTEEPPRFAPPPPVVKQG